MPPTQWDRHKLSYNRGKGSRSRNDRGDSGVVRCLTVKETGNGWSVDAEGSRDGLVITLVLNAAL